MHNDQDMAPSPEERFVDAALREQARLGIQSADDELVVEILSKTIHQNTNVETALSPLTPSADRRLWIASGIAAAAVLTLFTLGLSSLPYRSASTPEPEMQFSVRLLPPEEVEEVIEADAEPPLVAAHPHKNTFAPGAPDSPTFSGIELPDTVLEITTSFGPSFSSFPENPTRRDLFRIASTDESTSGHQHTYSGNVRINHNEFFIEADSVEVSTQTSGHLSEAPYLVAYDVILTQFEPSRRVSATRMTFNPEDRAFVLTGVRQLSTSEGKLSRFDRNDRIVLTANSLAIENATTQSEAEEVKYANPLPKTIK